VINCFFQPLTLSMKILSSTPWIHYLVWEICIKAYRIWSPPLCSLGNGKTVRNKKEGCLVEFDYKPLCQAWGNGEPDLLLVIRTMEQRSCLASQFQPCASRFISLGLTLNEVEILTTVSRGKYESSFLHSFNTYVFRTSSMSSLLVSVEKT
jgi:hypothetical protein